ncbi:MAG: hypothetical protein DMF88_00630 [Acidobacteria bacterium]|nr:MAG: hypothetical protein DMF88_00630 [Acidobacteriota bacterium]
MNSNSRRFLLLDPLRGAAALAVTLFHCVAVHPHVSESALGRVLLNGWMGVFIFFPISGYCIAAATQRHLRNGIGSFLGRRWRRIYPPYLASVALAVTIGVAALPFNHGSASAFVMPVGAWASVLTLTQVFTSYAGRINPVYWSLCYEEQFYLVMALSLLFTRARHRTAFLVAMSVGALVMNAAGWHLQGFFTDYWIAFAAGIGVYYCVGERANRRAGLMLLAVCVASAIVLHEVGTFVSLLAASAMLALAPVDGWFATRATRTWLKPAFALGFCSYSLYLIHVPIAGRVVSILLRVGAPVWLCAALGAAVSIACALLYFRWVERPFLVTRAPEVTRSLPSSQVQVSAAVV